MQGQYDVYHVWKEETCMVVIQGEKEEERFSKEEAT